MNLRPVSGTEFERYKVWAKGTGLTFGSRTQYFLAEVDGEVIGFCGVVWMKDSAKFKNDFVLPNHRGKGYFKEMVRERLRWVSDRRLKRVVACCTPMSLRHYKSVGFAEKKRHGNGCTDVELVSA